MKREERSPKKERGEDRLSSLEAITGNHQRSDGIRQPFFDLPSQTFDLVSYILRA